MFAQDSPKFDPGLTLKVSFYHLCTDSLMYTIVVFKVVRIDYFLIRLNLRDV